MTIGFISIDLSQQLKILPQTLLQQAKSITLILIAIDTKVFAIEIRILNKLKEVSLLGQIKVKKNVGGIEGLCIIEPTLHGDSRGYFMETYNKNDMAEAGLTMEFVQDNQSASSKGVLRGLHFQKQHPQGKLVRVITGVVFDVVVDLRKLMENGLARFFLPKTINNFIFRKDLLTAFLFSLTQQNSAINVLTSTIPEMKVVLPGTIRKSVSNGRKLPVSTLALQLLTAII